VVGLAFDRPRIPTPERVRIFIGFSGRHNSSKEALGNKAVKRSLHSDLFQMDVLGAD
jgi:hypothetical protein